MKSLLIDESGDLVFNGNELQMTDAATDIQQSVRIILETLLGEFFFDENLGLTHENLLGKNLNLEYLKQDIIDTIIEQEERISSVDSVFFNLDKANRHLVVHVKMTAEINAETTEVESEVRMGA